MRTPPPEVPLFNKLLGELGIKRFNRKYCNADGSIKDSAPEQLKREVALIDEWLGPPLPPGVRA